jgi:hypothetical protein
MIFSKRWMLLCGGAALFALSFIESATPAQAQFGFGLPGLPFRFHVGPGYRHGYGRRGGRGSKNDDSSAADDSGPRKGKDDKVVVSPGAPSVAEQTVALQRVATTTASSAEVGSAKDLKEVGKAAVNGQDRDYVARIREIIKKFQEAQKRDKNSTPGDVSAAAIEEALDKSFQKAKLNVFERFKSESWTGERLRSMILDRVENQVRSLLDGNNKGNAPMGQVELVISRAAQEIYGQIFETSELLASNKSSSQFMQRLYQTHGTLVDKELRESADYIITKASLTTLSPFEPAFQRDDVMGFTYRYRGQRIVFDCLTENVNALTQGDTEPAPLDVIRDRVAKMSNEVCSKWLEKQFGDTKAIPNPQTPVAMRTIWSPDGPTSAL